jgi:hypothetical protein
MYIKLSDISFTEQSIVHKGQKSNFIQRLHPKHCKSSHWHCINDAPSPSAVKVDTELD